MPDVDVLEKNIAAAERGIGETEKELSSLREQQTRLKKQGVPKNRTTAKSPDTAALTEDIADYTRHLSVLQQQLDAAFLILSDAPLRRGVSAESSALLDDPDMVITAAREEWLARAVAAQTVAAIRAESDNLDKTRRERQTLEQQHQKQAHAAQEYRQRLDNLAHQIAVTQNLLDGQSRELTAQRDGLAQKKRLITARRPARKPAVKPVAVTEVSPNPLLQPAAQHALPGRFPVNGRVVMKFGDKDALGAKSNGIVLEAAEGENIVLPQEGVIKFAGAFGKFKQLLIVEHKGGYHSLISGLDAMEIKIGERLPTGAVVGHLSQAQAYYELRHNGVPVDPDKVSMPF